MYRFWTDQEDFVLRGLYCDTDATSGQIAAVMGRTRAAVKNRVVHLGLKKPADKTNPGRFAPGHASWNKGNKGYQAGGRSAETRFKPGNRSGVAAEKWQPVGTERVTRDGYLQRKVNDDLPLHKRWKFLHVIAWEDANGPIPDGHVLVFVNGDKTDIRLDNLECISRRQLMLRNTVHNLPSELVEVVRLKSAITKRITHRTRKEQSA